MGVLHMAIPFHTPQPPLRRTELKAPRKSAAAGNTPGTLPAVPDLLTADRSTVSSTRTPEQLAEQAANLALVQSCLAGEQHAWHTLVKTQHKRVYAICFRFTNDATEAEDITQDVFLKVYRNLNSFDTSKGSFQTWITTLTRNLLVDNYRRTRLERASDSLDESQSSEEDGPTRLDALADTRPSQEQQYAGLELRSQIQTALTKLSPELREAVILRDLEDMDYKEIAVILKIPEGTVKSRISRGRAELARLLQRIEGQVM